MLADESASSTKKRAPGSLSRPLLPETLPPRAGATRRSRPRRRTAPCTYCTRAPGCPRRWPDDRHARTSSGPSTLSSPRRIADMATASAARGESLASHRDGRGAPPARRDDREPGPPPRVVCAVGWQYRQYLREEQRSPRRGPQRGSRVGVAWGCIAGRMQSDFHHGLLASNDDVEALRVDTMQCAPAHMRTRSSGLADIGRHHRSSSLVLRLHR